MRVYISDFISYNFEEKIHITISGFSILVSIRDCLHYYPEHLASVPGVFRCSEGQDRGWRRDVRSRGFCLGAWPVGVYQLTIGEQVT